MQLLLDGRVLVRYPSGVTEPIALDRVYHLDDGLDPDGLGDVADGMDEDGSSEGSQGSWQTDGGEAADEDAEWEDADEPEEGGWAEDDAVMEVDDEPEGIAVKEIVLPVAPSTDDNVSLPAEVEEHDDWRRFTMLEEAPQVRLSLVRSTVNSADIGRTSGPPLRTRTDSGAVEGIHGARQEGVQRPLLVLATCALFGSNRATIADLERSHQQTSSCARTRTAPTFCAA